MSHPRRGTGWLFALGIALLVFGVWLAGLTMRRPAKHRPAKSPHPEARRSVTG